eukprot:1418566-Amphidinium_carterae.1
MARGTGLTANAQCKRMQAASTQERDDLNDLKLHFVNAGRKTVEVVRATGVFQRAEDSALFHHCRHC